MGREFSVSELLAISRGEARYTTLNAYARMFTNNDRKAAVEHAKQRIAEYEEVFGKMRSEGWREVAPGLFVDDTWHDADELRQ
jgi:hypothetical protein